MKIIDQTVDQTLDLAAVYIDRHGWCQGQNQYPITGAVCARSAIAFACCDAPFLKTLVSPSLAIDPQVVSSPAYQEAMTCLRDFVGSNVIDWNDQQTNDPLNVTTSMRAAAALWRAQHAVSVEQPQLELAK